MRAKSKAVKYRNLAALLDEVRRLRGIVLEGRDVDTVSPVRETG